MSVHLPAFKPYPPAYSVRSNTLFKHSFSGFSGKICRSRHRGETAFEQYEDVHRIFITLDGGTRSTIGEVDDLPTARKPDEQGALTVVPAGVRRRVLLEDVDFLILSMSVSDSFLKLCMGDEEPGGASPHAPELPIVQNASNRWLLRAAQAFRSAGLNGAPSMHVETLAFAMIRHLTRSPQRIGESGGLDPVALSRVLEMMQDRLSEDLSLIEMATEAGLGVSAFSRGFAKSLGLSPCRYFTALRMQRAMDLLVHSGRPLAEIAGEIGYGDQAHFTAAFTRRFGVPPGKWRSEFRQSFNFLPISRKTSLHRIA
jgi:AraC-like DNA-binding protein